ncbi:MAG TPA: hemolysin family protein, partial [Longilinea sp.]|nr:hemolysin family protein [Longilinea sp.]
MSETFLEALLILLLILANGLFSMTEIALVSARKARLEEHAEDGDEKAKLALDLANSPNRLLSTTQVGITLVGILVGAVGNETLGNRLAALLATVPFLAPYAEGLALAIIVIVVSYFSLVLGELIPKRIALNDPERVGIAMSGFMRALEWLAHPFVVLLSHSTDLGMRLLRIKPSQEPVVTEDEVMGLIEQGTVTGVFEESEQDMVESVFRFGDRTVDAIMTPRSEIEWIDLDEPQDEIIKQVAASKHTRFPVAHEDLDDVQGFLRGRELLARCVNNEQVELNEMIEPPLLIPESMSALKMLELFKQKAVEIAVVIDEYGGTLGIVTLHDILTTIVGDIPDSGKEPEPEVVEREDGSLLLDGMIPVEELEDMLDINALPDEERAGYQTLGGLMMSQIGGVPVSGQH